MPGIGYGEGSRRVRCSDTTQKIDYLVRENRQLKEDIKSMKSHLDTILKKIEELKKELSNESKDDFLQM